MPFTLKLPNLWHLASDVEGTLTDGSTALDLIAAVHPTAAVAGTPTDAALAAHRRARAVRPRPLRRPGRLGRSGRRRRVGDRAALAQVAADGDVTAYAGAGIVADSDPERELAETKMKFRPIVEAFG